MRLFNKSLFGLALSVGVPSVQANPFENLEKANLNLKSERFDFIETGNLFIEFFDQMNEFFHQWWKEKVGSDSTDRAWNGVPGEPRKSERGYVKEDCPISLHRLRKNHIANFKDQRGIYLFYRGNCIPKSLSISEFAFSKLKGEFKACVCSFFGKSTLSKCEKFINDNFCMPVARLIQEESNQEDLDIPSLKVLLKLYSCYDRFDDGYPDFIQYGYGNTKEAVHACLVRVYTKIASYDNDTQKWLIGLLRNYNKSPYGKDAGIGQYNIDLSKFLNYLSQHVVSGGEWTREFLDMFQFVVVEWSKEEANFLNIRQQNAIILQAINAWNAVH